MRRLPVLIAVLLAVVIGACSNPYCDKDEFEVKAHCDTSYFPFVHPSGDTVTGTIVTCWTHGCAPKSILEP